MTFDEIEGIMMLGTILLTVLIAVTACCVGILLERHYESKKEEGEP